jgi:hypothetical protein
MIVTLLLKNQGFYSILFFVLNHYLYCKKNKLNYRMNTDNWLFTSINGWTDYFTNIELNYIVDVSKDVIYYDQKNTILDNFSLNEYRNAISEVYLYNEKTKAQIDEIKLFYNLNNNYSSIFIRRGDKLISESNYYSAGVYIETLLSAEPNCTKIFIQTDDYNCIIEAKEYVKNNNINVEILTLCNENTKGMIIISLFFSCVVCFGFDIIKFKQCFIFSTHEINFPIITSSLSFVKCIFKSKMHVLYFSLKYL